tara:strand:- start:9668 stop:11539 length:1872 start_codon:yes stop_codon:yes gene_type:complete
MATVKSSQVNITDLDFDDIADNLKEYLKGQSTLKDYNFEGSNISLLIDLLAYSSHVSAFNANMVASELFLDTAQIRKNVVSRAKEIGYTPTSATASMATIDLQVNNPLIGGETPTSLTLSRGHKFKTVYDGQSYPYVCLSSQTISPLNGVFKFENLEIYQGKMNSDIFAYNGQVQNQRFPLTEELVDTSTITVTIQSTGGGSSAWSKAEDISGVDKDTKVWYVQENDQGQFEVYFGDGVISAEPLDGDTITISYLVTNEQHTEGASQFTMTDAIGGNSDVTIINKTASSGGKAKEGIESIRFAASKFYTSQNRLVTVDDYKSKLQTLYPGADSISVWGGEDNDPPEYGKIFIAIKPSQNVNKLTSSEKTLLRDKMRRLNMLTVRPQIVDADIIDILVTTNFKFNPRATTKTVSELETLVRAAIITHDSTYLSGFDSIFRHSVLATDIDNAESSILSNTTTVKLRKTVSPTFGQSKGYEIEFGEGNKLYNPHSGHNKAGGGIIETTGFLVSGFTDTFYFDDDGNGNLRRYSLSGSTRVYADNQAGTVDYSNGKITTTGINILSTINTDDTIHFTVIPNSYDSVAYRSNLLDINTSLISVTGATDTIASGDTSAGVGYTSSSSYS